MSKKLAVMKWAHERALWTMVGVLLAGAAVTIGLTSCRAAKVAPKTIEQTASERKDIWPGWSAVGTVVDDHGRGMPGVTVAAHCGMGSLLQTGNAITDKDGRYELHFESVFLYADGSTGECALISARKLSYYEKNLYWQGNLSMSSLRASEAQTYSGRAILRGRPVHLDFVMLPAAVAQGQLLDAEGKPAAGKSLSLGSQRLPPGCSALDEVTTGSDGSFRFEEIPPNNRVWFCLGGGRNALSSPSIALPVPGLYKIKLHVLPDSGLVIDEFAPAAVPKP